ncbi:hypothetical protein D9Q98_005385 [Chlorella vulgaris]|uniref:sn-1-specific diacylglycerol lipase n=1 Tax=Chlorella vulgaris TaxID=3077 RepID=A0A9D4TLQ1_CHLVU|nr:hypothetical protein D9Q98_005385 [Chlorella vulgaris]
MPQLKLFNRRWHAATDALPALMAVLCLFHALWFVPYATGAWSIEGTGLEFQCAQATMLRVANYSLFALFGLAAVNECVLFIIGLRGGPFETEKRRLMTPLLYLEVTLWTLLLCFTIYATVVTYSGAVEATCWVNNPCQFNANLLPLACRDQSGAGVQELSDSCKSLVATGPAFFECWTDWMKYGLNWVAQTVHMVTEGWGYEVYVNALQDAAARLEPNYTRLADPSPGDIQSLASRFNSEAKPVADCALFFFLSCYFVRIDRWELIEALKKQSLNMPQPCTFFDPLYSAKSCQSLNVTWKPELLDEFGQCNKTVDVDYWQREINISVAIDYDTDTSRGNILVGTSSDVLEYNSYLKAHPDLFKYTNFELLKAINASTHINLITGVSNNDFKSSHAGDMPWFSCLDRTCQANTHLADDCTDWAQILALPTPNSRKGFFQTLVVTSWTVLGITALVLFVCFNAFPDYNDVDSWEGTVRKINRLCLCGGGLVGKASVSGSDMSVSHEIAKSLNLLFGGVDMDATDRLMGIYLVSERQHQRRQQDVLAALQLAGYAAPKRQPNRLVRAITRLTAKRTRRGQAALGGASMDDLSAGSSSAAKATAAPACSQPDKDDSADSLASPSAVPLTLGPGRPTANRQAGSPVPPDKRLQLYQHSMLRLRVNDANAGPSDSPDSTAAKLAALEEGASLSGHPAALRLLADQAGQGSVEPEQVLETPQQDAGGRVPEGIVQAASEPGGTSWQNSAIRVSARYCPLLTPSGCANGLKPLDPPITPQQAAEIYAGHLDAVDQATLKEAQRISRFAVASYGLQSVIWAQGKRPNMCLANANRLVKCFKRPFGLEDKFRKRNFDAIIEMTGVQPADLLYVSYTNVAGGVLPYLLMLHRPSKSVVVSVRGTVSMEDMVTDLLSNPVDVENWVPDWVDEEARRRKAAGIAGDQTGDSLKAHIGIVSSASAILKDMEDRGLLREMLLSKLMRTATRLGRDARDVVQEFLESEEDSAAQPVSAPASKGMKRFASLADNPLASSFKGAGFRDFASQSLGRHDARDAAKLRRAEQQHLSHILSMDAEREVQLPLQRAQTILREKLQLDGWKMVVTGHSLGAAVATLLGMQLRERFTDLQCWAFNPPGGLLSWELAQIAERYCTSVVVGKDVISRLSFNTSKRVVDEMVVSLARCKRPKLKVLFDVILGRRKQPASTPPTFCGFDEIAPEALQLVEQYYRASQLHLRGADTTEMYPPGRLVFLRPFKGKRKQQTVWDAVWIDAATLISEGILVTPTMMAHHRLYMLDEAFQSIFSGEAATEAAAQCEQGDEDVLHPL